MEEQAAGVAAAAAIPDVSVLILIPGASTSSAASSLSDARSSAEMLFPASSRRWWGTTASRLGSDSESKTAPESEVEEWSGREVEAERCPPGMDMAAAISPGLAVFPVDPAGEEKER